MKYEIFSISFLIFLLLCIGCSTQKEIIDQNKNTNSEIANPASVYCEEQGHQSVIMTDLDGSQYGVCVFSDGSECEEWAYFKGECEYE